MKQVIVVGAALAFGYALTIHAQEVNVTTQSGFGFVLKMPLEAKVVKGLPYSAEIVTESVQTLADGNRIVQRTTGRVYRDSEGRTRREEDRPSGGPTISVTDPMAGSTFTLDPVNRTARETPARLSVEITQALAKIEAQRAIALADAAKRLAAQAAGASA